MFDVIGKRRWFYLFSLLITIPGLFFILLTPTGSGGLQFTIDYTGGTRWEIRFQDPAVTPDQVKAVFAAQGLEASAVATGSGFIEIKTQQIVGLEENQPSATPVATLRRARAPARRLRPAVRPPAPASPRARARPRARAPAPSASASASAGAVGVGIGIGRSVRLAGAVGVARRVTLGIGRTDRQYRRSRPRASSARSRPPCRSSSARSPSSAA